MPATQRGLSLIEVLIVVALIAVLMAISLPMLSHANGEARALICQQNLANIGTAVTGHLIDYGELPVIAELPPSHPGTSLPEFIKPRLQSPNAMYCPSDETEHSQTLGTSYQWQTVYSGMQAESFDRVIDQPIVRDRDAFHHGTNMPSNELVLKRVNGKYQFIATGSINEQSAPSLKDTWFNP